MAEQNVALRKRQQIENAGKTMFLWVALAAAVVGIAVVLAVSLFEQISFNQKVLNEKNNTASILKKNNEIVPELKEKIRVLNTNNLLVSTPRLEGREPVSVILDGLPSTANSSALGASLQQKLLRKSGVTLESLVVDPIAGIEDADEDEDTHTAENTFEFTISAPAGEQGEDNLREILSDLERSIRVIDLTSVEIEQQNNKISIRAEGKAYFQPEVSVELGEKAVRP